MSGSATRVDRLSEAEQQDGKLHRSLGPWSLTLAGIGSVIGSGWLFSAMYAAQAAGPAALISWVIAGALMLLIALVFSELGMVRPESGGLVRYPLYASGRLAASVVGWSMYLSYVGNPPTEASATVQYASAYLPWVYDGERLTAAGVLLAIVLIALYVLVNYFGVQLFAKSNNVVTVVKVFIPVLTVVMLIASGFDSDNVSGHGGFAPYGVSASLGAIATAGLLFTYTGFRNIIELSGEARNPRKDLPRAMVATIVFTVVLYLGLQVAFLGAVPGGKLVKGWSGVNFDSPFADVAMLLGLSWLSWLLIADSMLSPSGSGIVYTAANARNVFGLGKNGFFPRWLMKVDDRRGVPVRALVLNFVVGAAFLLPLPSWHQIVQVMAAMAAFTFSIGSVAVMVFRGSGLGDASTRLRGMPLIAPAAFAVSSLVIFWESWPDLWKTIPIVGVGLVWYVVTYVAGDPDPADVPAGAWVVVHLVFVYAVAFAGSFGGQGWIHGPWDSLLVVVGSLLTYFWGVRAGTTYLTGHPELLEMLKRRGGEPNPEEIPV